MRKLITNKISWDLLLSPAKSQLTSHRVRHLLVDGMVELRDTLVRPVFTQLRKNLPQSVRPARVEPGGGVRNQAHNAKCWPVSETPASATAAAGGGRGPGAGVTAHRAVSLVCVCTSQGHHPGASETATRPKGQPFTLRKRLQPLSLFFSNCNSFYFFLPMPEFGDRIIKSFQELLLLSFGCAKRLAGS